MHCFFQPTRLPRAYSGSLATTRIALPILVFFIRTQHRTINTALTIMIVI